MRFVQAVDGWPRFAANRQVDCRFGTADEPGAEAPRAPGAPAPDLPPATVRSPAAWPLPEPLCWGQRQGAECWKGLASISADTLP